MHRRTFLRATGALAAAGVLPACGGDAGGDAAGAVPVDTTQPESLFVLQASFEYLTGAGRYLAFGVLDLENTPLEDADVDVYLRTLPATPDTEPQVLAGPLEATYSPPAASGQGVYYVQADLEDPGVVEILAVAGQDYGTAAIQVRAPDDSALPVPGEEAISAPTATVQDDLGQFALCTQEPPCGMHDISLDEALAAGRPTVLMFATPQFCQTAVCGPAVATLDEVRQSGDFGDVAFVHCEIFQERPEGTDLAGVPFTQAVQAWGLPTEPWLFTIDGDGRIFDRIDGPMPTPIVRDLVQRLAA